MVRLDRQRQEGAPLRSPLNRHVAALTTLDTVRRLTALGLREARAALELARLDEMLIDQLDLAAVSVAESLGIPFMTLCCAPPTYWTRRFHRPYFGWCSDHCGAAGCGIRNQMGNTVVLSLS